MPVSVSTERYEWSMGHRPRDHTYGRWAFKVGYETCYYSGTYGEVVEKAKARAKAYGIWSIEVLP